MSRIRSNNKDKQAASRLQCYEDALRMLTDKHQLDVGKSLTMHCCAYGL